MSGFLLGFMILFTLQHREEKAQTKGYSLSYSFKNSLKLKMKQKLDKPILRSVSLLLFAVLWVLWNLTILYSLWDSVGVGDLNFCCHCGFIWNLTHAAFPICRFSGCLVGVIFEFDLNQYCIWCRYIDCVPFKKWHCKDVAFSCAVCILYHF